ncbi:MAG: hypothetical protein ABEK02_06840 [Haloquadratum sp.]
MKPRSSFAALSRVIEQLGSDTRSVRRVEAEAGEDGGEPLRATIDVAMPLCGPDADSDPALAPQSASLTDGRLEVAYRPLSIETESPEIASARLSDAALAGDEVVLTFEAIVQGDADGADQQAPADPDDGSGPHRTGGTEAPAVDGPTDADDAGSDRSSPAAVFGRGVEETPQTERDGERPPSLAAVRDESVPPYEDTPYLTRLYEVCDTFEAMSERIEMDVSAETVRRYMIEAGVHTPTSYDTAEAADETDDATAATDDGDGATAEGGGGAPDPSDSNADEEHRRPPLPDEQLVTDGIGLPEELALQDIVDAVVGARTVYEVQRQLDLGQEQTRRLLRQLNVLDLVLRRVSDDPDGTPSYDVVTDRIRKCAPENS